MIYIYSDTHIEYRLTIRIKLETLNFTYNFTVTNVDVGQNVFFIYIIF